jgi:hypothetical protein
MTAIDLARALQRERGIDAEPSRNLVQSVHRALRAMVERGEVRRIPVEDGMSQWAFALTDDHLVPATLATAAPALENYMAIGIALVDALPATDAHALVDALTARVASR